MSNEKKKDVFDHALERTEKVIFVPEKYTAMTTDNLTPEEIREGNRIVAEYMELKLVHNDISGWCIEQPHNKLVSVNMIGYATNWEKIIPAWAKVAKDLRELSRTSACGYFPEYAHYFSTATEHDNKPSAFRALVAAIKLLNEKTK